MEYYSLNQNALARETDPATNSAFTGVEDSPLKEEFHLLQVLLHK